MKLLLRTIFALLISGHITAQTAGNALNLDGTDDNVTSNLPAFLNDLSTTDFTMEAWVRPQGNIFSRIIYAQGSASNFATISTGGTNNIYFYVIEGGTTYSIATNNTLPLNTWTHVAARWTTATNTVDVFFNGILQAGAGGGASSTGSLNNLSIGTRPGGAQYFPGSIDEVRIWSEARSNCEIAANYQRTMLGNEPNLVTYYNFDQGVAGSNNAGITNLPDLAGANNGTLNNFALTGTTSNWITSGASINANGQVPTITSNISASSCTNVPYSFNNQFLTSSGVYRDTLTAFSGCDSIIVLNFTSLNTTSSAASLSACGSYTWAQTGLTYNNSGTYRDTIPNFAGCDSVITLNLTVNQPTTATDTKTACNSYMWIDGITYTSSNTTATHTIIGGAVNGCDSIVTLNLTINNGASGTDVLSACDSYLWINGVTYTSSNSTATYTIIGGAANGCDSIVTLNLTISNIDLTVTTNTNTLTANQTGATYQWIDCNNGNAIIPTETSQSYTAAVSGNYAVIITNGSCSDTSTCYTINIVSINEANETTNITIYPNPANDKIFVQGIKNNTIISIYNALGELMFKETTSNEVTIKSLTPGIYFIRINEGQSYKLIKE